MEAYCVKCKAKKEMNDPKAVQTKKGGWMAKGKCACGCTMCKMMSKEDAAKLQ